VKVARDLPTIYCELLWFAGRLPAYAIDNHAGGKMNWDESFKLENCTLPDEYEGEAGKICEAKEKAKGGK